jgi:hypothetical protein
MSFQEFAAGSAELQPAGKEKLDSLLKGLYERPALEVEIEGSIAPEEDRDGLRQVAVEKKMRAQKWKSLGKSEQAATPAEKVELTADERPKWLKKLYAEALANGEIVSEGAKTNAPGSAPGARGATNQAPAQRSEPLHGGTALMEGLRASPTPDLAKATSPGKPKRAAIADAMEQALMEVIPITENDFKALAAERAKAVHEYLVQSGKVEKERLILAERQGAVKKDGSRAYLQLQ